MCVYSLVGCGNFMDQAFWNFWLHSCFREKCRCNACSNLMWSLLESHFVDCLFHYLKKCNERLLHHDSWSSMILYFFWIDGKIHIFCIRQKKLTETSYVEGPFFSEWCTSLYFSYADQLLIMAITLLFINILTDGWLFCLLVPANCRNLSSWSSWYTLVHRFNTFWHLPIS